MPKPKIVVIENPALTIEALSNTPLERTFYFEQCASFKEYSAKSNYGCHFLFLEAQSFIDVASEYYDLRFGRNDDVYTFTYHHHNNSEMLSSALEKGADDFFYLPVELDLLNVRLRAQHRRIQRVHKTFSKDNSMLEYMNLTIDPFAKEIFIKGKKVDLTHSEYIIIHTLAREPHYIYSMEYLFHLITGQKSLGDYNALMTHISRLRKKIAAFDPDHQYILTVRNKGYKFNISHFSASEDFQGFL